MLELLAAQLADPKTSSLRECHWEPFAPLAGSQMGTSMLERRGYARGWRRARQSEVLTKGREVLTSLDSPPLRPLLKLTAPARIAFGVCVCNSVCAARARVCVLTHSHPTPWKRCAPALAHVTVRRSIELLLLCPPYCNTYLLRKKAYLLPLAGFARRAAAASQRSSLDCKCRR